MEPTNPNQNQNQNNQNQDKNVPSQPSQPVQTPPLPPVENIQSPPPSIPPVPEATQVIDPTPTPLPSVPNPNPSPQPPPSSKKTVVGLSVVMMLLVLGGVTYYVFQNYEAYQSRPDAKATSPQTVLPTTPLSTPSPTPTPVNAEEQEVLNLQLADPDNEIKDIQTDVKSL